MWPDTGDGSPPGKRTDPRPFGAPKPPVSGSALARLGYNHTPAACPAEPSSGSDGAPPTALQTRYDGPESRADADPSAHAEALGRDSPLNRSNPMQVPLRAKAEVDKVAAVRSRRAADRLAARWIGQGGSILEALTPT